MANVIIILIVLTAFLFTPKSVFAAKARVVKKVVVPAKAVVVATKPTVYVKIRNDRRALTLTFYGLNTANSANYELTYVGNGIEQGVFGSIPSSEGSTASRQLLLGTCSKLVCTYHRNVSSVKLKVTYKLKTNKTLIKRFTIRI